MNNCSLGHFHKPADNSYLGLYSAYLPTGTRVASLRRRSTLTSPQPDSPIGETKLRLGPKLPYDKQAEYLIFPRRTGCFV
ncbi:MAG: hypothetical protein A3B16_00890 [Candidatus Zambryskibacteria bacterium RIFCSPLOWO2_01_FULL_45_43]|uniref:Uncharacterized protein n=1 Tax=Candidatus Zambryskibacteria bacterium RIFCSPLOWO2_01_FULL_45_43 TaxID=1802762 RepID=A0A1G2U995_9BACT|nr:MAG: hypothetical protein A3B16_00890 [Candidatus Zambryskibacteria bacterium RIFCSPLOWO2_01_FULL_45_43]